MLSESSVGAKALWVGISDQTGTKAQSGDNTCWAASFAFITGQNSETLFKLYTSLDSSIRGILDKEEGELIKDLTSVGINIIKRDSWSQDLASLGDKFGTILPMAVALPDHYIVVTAVELNPSRTNCTQVRYWDPADNTYSTVSRENFLKLKPSHGYIMKK